MQTLLRNVLLGGGGGYSPASLFAGGVEGALYDPSDLSTLYQDSAGTTPVTGVEQVVGLMLDKSKNLALGPELVTNGDFSDGSTGWTAGAAGVTITGGAVVYVSVSSTFTLRQSGVITAEKTYEVQFEITAYTSGTIQAKLNGTVSALGLSRSAAGIYREYITSTSTADGVLAFAVSGFTGTIDNISVRELPGNHATSTGSARPTLSARVNLLTYSEEFSNPAWGNTRATVTNNTVAAPNGTLTADYLQQTAGQTNYGFVAQTFTYSATVYTHSVYAKKSEKRYCILRSNEVTASGVYLAAWFDLDTGLLGTVDSGLTASMTSVGNGWYRCSITLTARAGVFAISCGHGDTNGSLTVSDSGGIYLWGADLRVANIGVNIPSYQRIAAATNYDTNGFPFYLSFGGAQSMSTPANLDLTSTDKVTVYAGVRKLSDAARGMVAETSTTVGVFQLNAPSGAGVANYEFRSKGTLEGTASSPTSYPSPITSVLTGLGDISGDSTILRINGTQAASSTADQGTGNYGTYPLYIGSRAGSSLFFTGYLYSLIIQGTTASATQLASTEAWVNQKTKAY